MRFSLLIPLIKWIAYISKTCLGLLKYYLEEIPNIRGVSLKEVRRPSQVPSLEECLGITKFSMTKLDVEENEVRSIEFFIYTGSDS